MKSAILKLLLWVLLIVATALALHNWHLRRLNQALLDTIDELEQERRATARAAPTPPATNPVASREEERRRVEQQVSELRGLSFRQPVNYRQIPRAQLREVLLEEVRRQFTPEDARRYGRALEALGLIPRGTDLMALMIGLYDEQVGAFYLPRERALYTFEDLPLSTAVDRMILAHELVHALQDQHYDLTKWPLHVKDNDDLALAAAALLEGDATVLMTQHYALHAPPAGMWSDLLTMLLGQRTEKLRAAPAYLRELMLFPYQAGQRFVLALQMDGGLDALHRAFQQPPTSTEQILHPHKFLQARDEPVAVTVEVQPPLGWERIADNVLGEFGIRTKLAQALPLTEASDAAAGWGGDRYHVFERGVGGPLAVVWWSVWDDEKEAEEFAQAYRRYLEKQNRRAQVVLDERRVEVVFSEDDQFAATSR
ncbi:MAG: hypothetical protein RMM51_08250 [Verrucomicrobiae bacterium]|nr:hypothetical protein [Verrucomicrobiae bacterium]